MHFELHWNILNKKDMEKSCMQPNKYGLTGKGVGVAVIDTGIFPHPDFDNRITVFRDYIMNRRYPYDDNGHGTHVAGIIAGNGRRSKGKYCGVAPGCTLAALKVLDKKGNGRKKDVLQALRWVQRNRERYGIRIINISVGSTEQDISLHDSLIKAVDAAWDDGLVVITAAGNMGPMPGTITAPGSSRKVITVGSGDMLVSNQGISGRGPTRECICKPDIVAPGNQIISCAPFGGYARKSGTSMSTPQISGAAALALEADPLLTNVDIKMLLRDSARDLGFEKNQQGWGEFCLDKFLKNVYN